MKKLLLASFLCLLSPAAWAQCNGVFPTNTLCGNLGASAAPPSSWAAPQGFGGLNAQTSAYTVTTSDCSKTITLGGNGFYALTFPSAGPFPAACIITAVNTDTTRAKKMTVSGVTFPNGGVLWPGQATTIQNANSTWTIISNPGSWNLSQATTLYASPSGSDTANDCLAAGSPCATITHAAALFCSYIYQNNQNFEISAGAQVENVTLCAYRPSGVLQNPIWPTIVATSIIPTSGTAVTAVGVMTPWLIENTGIEVADTSTTCVEADINSLIYIASDTFFTCGIAMQALYNGKIEIEGSGFTLSSAVAYVAATNTGGQFLNAHAVTCSGPFTTTAFVQATDNSVQNWTGATFSGCSGVTGIRANASLGGGIDTGGGGQSFFPGNTNGTVTSPGWLN